MNLIPWRRKREHDGGQRESENPLALFRREIDTLFDRFFDEPWSPLGIDLPLAGVATPRMDLADTENDVTVTMELPGVEPEQVQIGISGGMLTIRGEKREQKEEKRKNVHFSERRFGGFQRSVQLPSSVDPEKVDAKFKNGVLTVTVAKRAEAKPKRIKVRNA